jgi:hypothetical protein
MIIIKRRKTVYNPRSKAADEGGIQKTRKASGYDVSPVGKARLITKKGVHGPLPPLKKKASLFFTIEDTDIHILIRQLVTAHFLIHLAAPAARTENIFHVHGKK